VKKPAHFALHFIRPALWGLAALLMDSCKPEEKVMHSQVVTATTPVEQYGQLKVLGNQVVGQDGQAVQLRGMSLFWSQWMGKYYNAEAVKWLQQDWRCTVVRAAMAVDRGGYLQNPAAEKQKVIAVVDAAIQQGLYVIIDWHDHKAENHTEEAKAFFTDMAQRYGDKPNVIYELYNEPMNVSWTTVIKPYHETLIQAIRQHDPDNLIVCGTRNWSQEVEEAADNPIDKPNIAYTLHYYASTHKQGLRDKATRALNKGVALMVTEFGLSEASGTGFLDQAETRTWWRFLDQHKISWCNWSVTDKNETSAALRPGAKAAGNWTPDEISASGTFVREELRARNPVKP
jgi:endoglucanase